MEYTIDKWSTISSGPGIYQYFDSESNLLYIGKAKNLKKRVSQYFTDTHQVSEKTRILVSQIASIFTIETESEFDAVLLESKLIREKQPKYNILSKDDKSPLYVFLTVHEELPHVMYVRKHDKDSLKLSKKDAIFGPFQSGRLIRSLLLSLRYSIPFCLQKKRNGRACFSSHLALCTPCPSEIFGMKESELKNERIRAYRKNIYALKKLLSGHFEVVRKQYVKEMHDYSRNMKFEDALIMRRHIEALDALKRRSFDPSVYMEGDQKIDDIFLAELDSAKKLLKFFGIHIQILRRIECIDISNTQGTNATGALTVSIDGHAVPGEYRKFRIRLKQSPDDVFMMAEVMKRRMSHPEWRYPELFIVDGGKGQILSAMKILDEFQSDIPIIGLAKRFETLLYYHRSTKSFQSVRLSQDNPSLHLFQRIRDEAHRFSKSYHVHLRSRGMKLA